MIEYCEKLYKAAMIAGQYGNKAKDQTLRQKLYIEEDILRQYAREITEIVNKAEIVLNNTRKYVTEVINESD